MNQCRMPGYACYFINTVSTTACWLNPIPIVGFDGGFSSDAGTASFIGAACVNAGQCTNPSNAFCIQDVIPGLGAYSPKSANGKLITTIMPTTDRAIAPTA